MRTYSIAQESIQYSVMAYLGKESKERVGMTDSFCCTSETSTTKVADLIGERWGGYTLLEMSNDLELLQFKGVSANLL